MQTPNVSPETAGLSIGQLARKAGVGIDAIRFYERTGLMPPPRRRASGYRIYGAEDLERLGFIRRAQAFGFALEEIRILLQSRRNPDGVGATRALAVQKLAALETRAADLLRLKADLEVLVRNCPGSGEAARCPILEAFSSTAQPETGAA